MALSRSKEKLLGRLKNRRMREREGLVLVEGRRAAGEVAKSGVPLRFALVASDFAESSNENADLVRRMEAAGAEVESVAEDVLAGLSDTESPQGILVVCAEPEFSPDALVDDPDARLLVLDGVQDPGNVGTLIRAARAFASTGVVALDGTADPWNPKAVRAAVGSSFHVPVVRARWDDLSHSMIDGRPGLLVADAGGMDVAGAGSEPPWALVIGSEASGARPAIRDRADQLVAVPMPGGAESLNAAMAGSILLHVLTRRNERAFDQGMGAE